MAASAFPPLFIVMAGGSGTRFWPVSSASLPKQYLNLFSKHSLLQETVDRISPICSKDSLFIVSNESQKKHLTDQVGNKAALLFEPSSRNTAPCLMYLLWELSKRKISDSHPLVVSPADHFIHDAERFRKVLWEAIQFVSKGDRVVVLGVPPRSPHTGYGYIHADPSTTEIEHASKVLRFVEKPTLEKAEGFLKAGGYYWNAGIFVWTVGSLRQAFERFMPSEFQSVMRCKDRAAVTAAFQNLPSISIDVGVMERTDNAYVIPIDVGWSDVGSWNALYELKRGSPSSNVEDGGHAVFLDAQSNYVQVEEQNKVALIGVSDLIVIQKGDKILIAHRKSDQLVRDAAKAFDVLPARRKR